MGILRRIAFGDPTCTRHGVPLTRNGGCDRCSRKQVPGERGRRAQPTRPGQTRKTSHQPHPCPVAGCGGTVRGGVCPRLDLHP